jgi:hypothetical protein
MLEYKIVITLILMVALLAFVGYHYINANKIKIISKIPYSNGHCSLREDGWVVIECSGSKDMLPITLVSQELINAFEKDLESKNGN